MTEKPLSIHDRNEPFHELTENRPGDALKLARLNLERLRLERELAGLKTNTATGGDDGRT